MKVSERIRKRIENKIDIVDIEILKLEEELQRRPAMTFEYKEELYQRHDEIMSRLKILKKERNKLSFKCNDNISEFIEKGELDELVEELKETFDGVLESLVIDTSNDHNTEDTARRVAKMMLLETFSGRYQEQPKITSFPNDKNYDQLYIVGPISIRSTCAHHFQNIIGTCWIGVHPGEKVIGISKFNRIVNWLARRPSIQEELTEQIADKIEELTEAKGVAVFMRAEHQCMTQRGVLEHESDMKTSVMRGALREDVELKKEFFSMLDI